MFPEFLQLLLLVLVPVAIYCTALAVVNRRPHPLMVRGPWDFTALLFAASGLLLVLVPSLINHYFENAAADLVFQEERPSEEAFDSLKTLWWFVWGGYYVLVAVVGVVLVWLRRGKTVVYNVNHADFERAFDAALDRLGLQAVRNGSRVLIGPAARGEAAVDVEPLASLWNVTLHWAEPTSPLRRQFEAELAAALGEVFSYENPVGGWLMGAAGFLFALIFMTIGGVILSLFFPLKS